jgi:hypothetical protein
LQDYAVLRFLDGYGQHGSILLRESASDHNRRIKTEYQREKWRGPIFSRHRLTSAAKAGPENRSLIAAVNRCATQNQEQQQLFPQPVKPDSKQSSYRSGKPLRHPKIKSNSTFFRPVKPDSKQSSYRSGKPLRHPKSRATAPFSAPVTAGFKTKQLSQR